MKYKILLLVVSVLFSVCPIVASNGFGQPDIDYNEGKYVEAIKGYQKIIHKKGTSAEILYNLGNAYYQVNQYGEAMLCYARAHKLDPHNKQINNNISVLENKVTDANKALRSAEIESVDVDEKTFFQNIQDVIATENTSNYWSVFAVMSFILFLTSLALYFFAANVLTRKVGFFGGLLFLFFSVVFLVFTFMAAHQYVSTDKGVIMEYQCELRKEATEEAKASCPKLTVGTVVDIVEEEIGVNGKPSWYKVRLNSSYIGWIPASQLEVI